MTPSDLHDPRIAFGPFRLDPRTITYSTILMLTAVALLNPQSETMTAGDLLVGFWVLLGPLFAISMAHGFSEAIDLQIRYRRRLTWADRRHLAAVNLQYLIIGVIAFVVLLVPFALGWSTEAALNLMYVLGVGSLMFWGGVAAYKAGLPRGRQIVLGLNYGILGFMIVIVEVWIRH